MTDHRPQASRASGNAIHLIRLAYGSELERLAYSLLETAKDVRRVTAQPDYKIRFTDKNGQIAHVQFDFHVDFVNGLRVATAVTKGRKNASLRAMQTHIETTGRIEREDGTFGALREAFDDFTFLTEESVLRCSPIHRPNPESVGPASAG